MRTSIPCGRGMRYRTPARCPPSREESESRACSERDEHGTSEAGESQPGWGGAQKRRTEACSNECRGRGAWHTGTYYNEPYQQGRCQRSSRCTRSGRRGATRCPRMISPGEIRRLIRAGVRATSCFTVVHQSCGPVIPCCLLIELRCPREQRVRGQSPGERGRSGMPGETETNADCMADGHERLDAPALVLWLAKPGDVVLRESLRQRHSRQGDGRLRPERAETLTRR